MMNPSNGKGDKQRPANQNMKHVHNEMDRLFPEEKKETGRFKQDKLTGKFIPIAEWNALYYKPKPKTHYVIGDIEPYTSPIDGKVIGSRVDNREDLLRNNCRQWEGTEQETMVANQHKQDEDMKFENKVGDIVEETFHDIKEGRVTPDANDKIDFTFGKD